jgi:hypothetical protein
MGVTLPMLECEKILNTELDGKRLVYHIDLTTFLDVKPGIPHQKK